MSRAKLSQIIECFEAHGSLSLDELSELMSTSSKSARVAVKSLVNSGFLEMVPIGPVTVWDHDDLSSSVRFRLTGLGGL